MNRGRIFLAGVLLGVACASAATVAAVSSSPVISGPEWDPAFDAELQQAFAAPGPLGERSYGLVMAYLLTSFSDRERPGGSRVDQPGARSRHGLDVDAMEGFTRLAPLVAAWLAGGRDGVVTDLRGRRIDLLAWLRQGVVAGTTPGTPAYWGPIGDRAQSVVEAADVARSVWVVRDTLLPTLSDAERANLFAWLRQAVRVEVPDNNWHLYPVLIHEVLAALGAPGDAGIAAAHFRRFMQFRIGQGWYGDGPGPDSVDWYNAWAIHYELWWLRRVSPGFGGAPVAGDLAAFARDLAYLVSPDGIPIMGRSVCYRLAAPAPLVAAALDAGPGQSGRRGPGASGPRRHLGALRCARSDYGRHGDPGLLWRRPAGPGQLFRERRAACGRCGRWSWPSCRRRARRSGPSRRCRCPSRRATTCVRCRCSAGGSSAPGRPARSGSCGPGRTGRKPRSSPTAGGGGWSRWCSGSGPTGRTTMPRNTTSRAIPRPRRSAVAWPRNDDVMPLAAVIEDVAAAIFRRRGLVLALILLLGGAAMALIAVSPPRYVARTAVLAKFGREYTLRGYGAGNDMVPANFGQDQIVSSVIEIMRSDEIARRVVEAVGVDRLYPALTEARVSLPERAVQDAALRFGADMTVTSAAHSNVVAVELSNPDPGIAAEALNRFVAIFQQKYRELYGEQMVALFEAEAQSARGEFAAAQERVAEFERSQRVFAQDGQMDRLIQDKAQLEQQLSKLASCCSETSAFRQLRRDAGDLDARIAALSAGQATLQDLLRQRDSAQQVLDAATRRLQEARNASSMDAAGTASVRVVSPATPPTHAARPGRLARMLLALLLVSAGSLATGFVVEAFSRRFSSAGELRGSFAVPVRAEVPFVGRR